MQSQKRPVTVVTGFLGSGKTTLLNQVLDHPSMKHTAVIVNEYGKVGLDHHLLRQADEQIMLLKGGCLCCSIRQDLVAALKELLDLDERGAIPKLERVIIETSGLADPVPILSTILSDPVLQHRYYVDLVLVTVDAVNGHLHLDRQPEAVKQVSVSDKVIVTKSDLTASTEIEKLAVRIREINPSVRMLEAVSGNVNPNELFREESGDPLNHSLSNTRFISQPEQEHLTGTRHAAQTKSLSLSFDQPLDWTAFGIWLSMLLHARGEDVLRVKGFLDVGETGPVVLNGVQHIIHPPQHMTSWPDTDTRSHLVFITRDMEPLEIYVSLSALQQFLGARPVLLGADVLV